MITPTEYKKSLSNLEKLYKDIEAEKNKNDDVVKKIRDKFWEEKRNVEDRERDELSKHENGCTECIKALEADCKPYEEIEDKAKRIFKLIEVIKGDKDLTFDVYYYSDRDENGNYISEERKRSIKPIDTIVSDEFKVINIYIAQNKKPTNKYSLFAAGRTIFNDENLIMRLRNYIQCCHTDHCNIELILKEMPTEEGLKLWYEKNKSNILKEYLEKHTEMESEYKETVELSKDKEWQILYLENLKDYYEKGVSHGEETEEYKSIVKELKKLRG